MLEVVFGGPERVETELVHDFRDAAGHEKRLPEAFAGVAAVVGGRAVFADIVELDVADIEGMEAFDHGGVLGLSGRLRDKAGGVKRFGGADSG